MAIAIIKPGHCCPLKRRSTVSGFLEDYATVVAGLIANDVMIANDVLMVYSPEAPEAVTLAGRIQELY